ncbi:MAG: phosphotransferase [Candidatus Nanopelagicales bacterium]
MASAAEIDPFAGLPDAERLRRVPALVGALTAEPLSGGITNRNYKVTLASGPVVVRAYEHESSALAINRENEYRNSVAAAESGAGAPVIEYLPDENMLIVGWIEGRTFSEADVREPENLPRIAEACRMLHAGPRFVNDFNMFEIQARYLALVRERGFRLPPRYEEFLPQVERMREAMTARPEPTVPCNNDLLAGNFIDEGSRIRLIDYEYSGNNEASFELGNIWSESTLPDDLLEVLVHSYWGDLGAESLEAKVARARLWGLMSKYGWTLWASISASISPIDFDYWGWGMEKYERAVAEFDGPELARLLEVLTK